MYTVTLAEEYLSAATKLSPLNIMDALVFTTVPSSIFKLDVPDLRTELVKELRSALVLDKAGKYISILGAVNDLEEASFYKQQAMNLTGDAEDSLRDLFGQGAGIRNLSSTFRSVGSGEDLGDGFTNALRQLVRGVSQDDGMGDDLRSLLSMDDGLSSVLDLAANHSRSFNVNEYAHMMGY